MASLEHKVTLPEEETEEDKVGVATREGRGHCVSIFEMVHDQLESRIFSIVAMVTITGEERDKGTRCYRDGRSIPE